MSSIIVKNSINFFIIILNKKFPRTKEQIDVLDQCEQLIKSDRYSDQISDQLISQWY